MAAVFDFWGIRDELSTPHGVFGMHAWQEGTCFSRILNKLPEMIAPKKHVCFYGYVSAMACVIEGFLYGDIL